MAGRSSRRTVRLQVALQAVDAAADNGRRVDDLHGESVEDRGPEFHIQGNHWVDLGFVRSYFWNDAGHRAISLVLLASDIGRVDET
jgi:hypothetical protein